MIRLAFGVVAGNELRAWGPGMVAAQDDTLPPGAAVAVGPASADPSQVRPALDALATLDRESAGAGVDLGHGFGSARLEGATGDRRDAVLAALRLLGLDGLDRLGDRTAVLVALFGATATKPVAAAAGRAIDEERWAALHLASAASDLLGPEQLEVVLDLKAVADPIPHGRASDLASQLSRVLDTLPRPRRLDLILDLWKQVDEGEAARLRRERLRSTQGRRERKHDLIRRYAHFEEAEVLEHLRAQLGPDASLAQAARWIPPMRYWISCLNRMVDAAFAAMTLIRTSVAVSDHGLTEGLDCSLDALAASALDDAVAARAARPVPGLTGLPALPGCYVRDLLAKAGRGPLTAKDQAFVRQRLPSARDYGLAIMESAAELVYQLWELPAAFREQLAREAGARLRQWRAVAEFTRTPYEWDQPPVIGGGGPTLAERLRAQPEASPAETESFDDFLWYAELADALAQLNGHECAQAHPGRGLPWFDLDPADEHAPPHPRLDSIPLAVAGTAQLVALGGGDPPRSRTWMELIEGLMARAAVAEALTGAFRVPGPLSEADGGTIPGTQLRVELARSPRKLAEWSDYMGNCIASPGFIDAASEGECGLVGLREPSGRLVANLELRPARPAGKGWRVEEFAARFNAAPEPDLANRVEEWVKTLPGIAVAPVAPAEPAAPAPRRIRRGRRDRLLEEAGDLLERLIAGVMDEPRTVEAVRTLDRMARRSFEDPLEPLTALRRHRQDHLIALCRDALGGMGLGMLWRATEVRPMTAALAKLDPAIMRRYERLSLLARDLPLPGSLRALARRPGIAPARSMELMSLRIRAALGGLVRSGDPVLAGAVTRGADIPILCSLVIAVTTWGRGPGRELTTVMPRKRVTVPGFPTINLKDDAGPWRAAMTGAAELGADIERFWDGIAEHGLLVPSAWIGREGWPALWSRAARR